MKKMRIKAIGACLIVSFLAVLLLSNTVSAAGGPIGQPIGVQNVTFIPSGPFFPGQEVKVNITWWITHPDYQNYTGPFGLKISLKSDLSTKTEIEEWRIHETIYCAHPAVESNPCFYNFTRYAPGEVGKYTLEVQINATEIMREIDNQNRYRLVASDEPTLTTVPEFTTIAIPAAAILGLLFFFNHRKRRKAK